MNVEFLGKFLESEEEYWIVAAENTFRTYGRSERGPDEIFLIARPDDCPSGMEYGEITLGMLNDLENSVVQNVPLNTIYTPFQSSVKMSKFYMGRPVPTNIVRDVLSEGLKLKSNSLFEFESLIGEIIKRQTEEENVKNR